MKKYIKKFINYKTLPFIVFFIVVFVLNIFKSPTTVDDEWFAKILTGEINPEITNMAEFLSCRYETWSSRLIIEFVLVTFSMAPKIIWCLFDAFMYTLLAYGLFSVFCYNNKENRYFRWITVGLLYLIQPEFLISAGWIATSANYFWVISAGIICLLPLRKTLDDKPIKWYEYFIYIPLMLFATNSEQMCAVLLVIYLLFSAYFIFKKKIRPIHIILLLISIASMIFILTCPGNKSRTALEIAHFFNDFESLSFIQKSEISVISTMQHYMFDFNIIYFIFTALLACWIHKKYPKKILYNIIAIIPFIVCLITNAFTALNIGLFKNIGWTALQYIDSTNYTDIKAYIYIALSIIILAIIVLSVFLAFDSKKKKIVATLCILAGLATRLLMGFIPSCYTSGIRTHIILMICMIIISIMILDEFSNKKLKICSFVMLPAAIVSIIYNCIFIIQNQ